MLLPEMLALLVEDHAEAIVLTDTDLAPPGPRVLYVNQAFLRMTGYDRAEILGNSPRILQGPRTSRLELRKLVRHLAAGKPYATTVANYRKNGERYLCGIDVRPLVGPDGNTLYFFAVEREVLRYRRRPSKVAPSSAG